VDRNRKFMITTECQHADEGSQGGDGWQKEILTVDELNQAVSAMLAHNIPMLWVRGEISMFTAAASGHWYFTLKDQQSVVRAVMFRGRATAVGFLPRVGDRVEVRARVSLYEPRGDYQLQVDGMRRAGVGGLFEAFLRLKEKLAAEGLFLPDRKRPVTLLPNALGVVTSLHAAALRDVLAVLARRAPQVPIILYPAPVQGADAAAQLVAAIATANRRVEVDTLLLVRGGGSIEDLWSFNDEALARAVAASSIPIISGVGHETDFTIVDFVADVRAPTPTAAAELACVARADLYQQVMQLARHLVRAQERRLERLAQRLDRCTEQLVSPVQRCAHQRERLAGLLHRLRHAWLALQNQRQAQVALLRVHLAHRRPDPSRASGRLRDQKQRLQQAHSGLIRRHIDHLQALLRQLHTISPQHVLARGYTLVHDEKGGLIRDAASLMPGQTVALTFAQGRAKAAVTTVETASG
jgi:exodeoxyribonuclease VII large subunit